MNKNFTLTFLTLFIYLNGYSQGPDWLWAKTFNGTDVEQANSLCFDKNKSLYCAGTFEGTVDFDPGSGIVNLPYALSPTCFVTKLDSMGNLIWVKGTSGWGNSFLYSIASDENANVYLTGSYSGTVDFDPGNDTCNLTTLGTAMFICKLDSSGNFLWARSVSNDNNVWSNSIKIDLDGSVFTTGYFIGDCDFDPGLDTLNLHNSGWKDIFILKLDSIGNFAWAHNIGGYNEDVGKSLLVDPAGNILVTGIFKDSVDFNPDSTIIDNKFSIDGGLFICKFNNAGELIWVKTIGGTPNYMNIDYDGSIYLTGYMEGTMDFDPDSTNVYNLSSNGSTDLFILKLTSNGELVWAKNIGSSWSEGGSAIAIDNSKNIYTAGTFNHTVDFNSDSLEDFNLTPEGSDFFILKLDSMGNFIWVEQSVGSEEEFVNSILIDEDNRAYTCGNFTGPYTIFGDETLPNSHKNLLASFIAMFQNSVIGIEEFKNKNSIIIFPNPGSANIYIQSTFNEISSLKIYNLIGKEIYFKTSLGFKVTVDCRHFPKGLYFVECKTEKGSSVQKLIIQ